MLLTYALRLQNKFVFFKLACVRHTQAFTLSQNQTHNCLKNYLIIFFLKNPHNFNFFLIYLKCF